MLYEFLEDHHDAIVARARSRADASRSHAAPADPAPGVPAFLAQLSEMLRLPRADDDDTAAHAGLATAAAQHGRDLLGIGYTISDVVHDYGNVCQAITELADELDAPLTTAEFNTLNWCLDVSIATAVTEHVRVTDEERTADEFLRLGEFAHEMRNMLNTATLALAVVQRGTVGLNGSTGAVLSRSLAGLRDLIDSALADIRAAAGHPQPEVLLVSVALDEFGAAARLRAEEQGLHFTLDPVDGDLAVRVDPQLLASAVTNLLSNAFKYTQRGGHVVMRAHLRGGRVVIEVQDQCGGIVGSLGDVFQPFGQRRAADSSGLGLGLSIARKAVRVHGGDITVRNTPGVGCTFSIDLANAAMTTAAPGPAAGG
ncbi:hypothetical protein TBR22_A47210 [Luteitalea sp. TBR-22]|uniref:sensor histidine kinase n=1 Tax=Luteitalea sp. TBR-22 TaxID=2802971 RepID=UPI001AFC339E|nr:HAMP domain-containing sensor histidine kinase [Luteitalea sp. TBR-22]BCS35490.1 hypothetical protein TBR22_A47210 [Luteitalea sp. TBR-22]